MEAFSKTGAKALHGPHHPAQKSTKVIPPLRITPSNSELVTLMVLTKAGVLEAKKINYYRTDNAAPLQTERGLPQYVGHNQTRLPCHSDRISLHYTYLLSPTSFRIILKINQALLDHSDDPDSAATLEFHALLAQHAVRILTKKLCRTFGK